MSNSSNVAMQEQNEILTDNFMAGETNSCQQNHYADCFLESKLSYLCLFILQRRAVCFSLFDLLFIICLSLIF